MSRRRIYLAERRRTQRDGRAGLALYKKERLQKVWRNRWKPYNAHKTLARILSGRPVPGQRLRRRRQ